jgi:hypothetical protein
MPWALSPRIPRSFPQPSTLNPQPSTLNPQPSTLYQVAHVEVWAVQPEEDEDEEEEEQNFFVDEIAEMRNPKKKSVLKNGVER